MPRSNNRERALGRSDRSTQSPAGEGSSWASVGSLGILRCIQNPRRPLMHLPLDEDFLRWAERAVGSECLVQMIRAELARRVGTEKQTDFLDRLKIRGHWQRSIVGMEIQSHADLATVI